jgi:5-methyltetrahydropteroyltriglutamate--homocysteine methyltransferase
MQHSDERILTSHVGSLVRTPRHEHEWEIWRDIKLPAGKILMPGVVIARTDCGFSQGWNSPGVHEQVQWAKLEALAEGARIATQRLWGR